MPDFGFFWEGKKGNEIQNDAAPEIRGEKV
jgi:hypothetical protein